MNMVWVTDETGARVFINLAQVERVCFLSEDVYQVVFASGRWIWIPQSSMNAIQAESAKTPSIEAFVRREEY